MTAADRRMMTAAPSATEEQAAAIAAAIERFTHDTAPAQIGAGETLDPWTRTAMLEGVRREADVDVPHPWINT
jgi:hypothetical protein